MSFLKNLLTRIQNFLLDLDRRTDAYVIPFEKGFMALGEDMVQFFENIYVGSEIVFMAIVRYVNASFEARVIRLEEALTPFGIALEAFAVRWSLWWYLFCVQYVILALICIAIGFGMGTIGIMLFYDDGTERVMDVYNYFKNPPRR